MKARRLAEVRSLVARPDFQSWWEDLQRARAAGTHARHHYEELLSQTTLTEFRAELTQKNAIDTLYRAGELEDLAATLLVEAQGLENQSLLRVADFEEQRFRASEAWYRLGAAERTLEDAAGPGEVALRGAQKTHRVAQEEYDRENGRKEHLWEEVERLWARCAEVSLLVSEHKVRGKKIRREAEALFAQAEERKVRGRALRAEAEAASLAAESAEREVKRLLDDAQERFGCTAGSEFLFFRVKDSPKLAFALALVEDRDNFNVEVKPLTVFTVGRQRGVAFLEPARAEVPSEEDGDRRFEEYFLSGRKGEARTVGT